MKKLRFIPAAVLLVSLVLCACHRDAENSGNQAETTNMPVHTEQNREDNVTPVLPMQEENITPMLPEAGTGTEPGAQDIALLEGNFLRENTETESSVLFHVRKTEAGYEAIFFIAYAPEDDYFPNEKMNGVVSEDKAAIVFEDESGICTVCCTDGEHIQIDMAEEYRGINVSGTYIRTVPELLFGEGMERPQHPAYERDRNCEVELDSTLAHAIRTELFLADGEYLSEELLASIYELRIFDEKITSLKGISNLSNLHLLAINSGYISDISELGQLTQLESIDISWCYIREIPDFSRLTKLRELRLAANLVEDLSPLNRIPNLELADLDSNRVKSVACLAENTSIKSLGLSGNCITDYSSLQGHSSITQAIDENGMYTYEGMLLVENEAKRIVSEITNASMTELEKETAIYKYIMDNTVFQSGTFRTLAYGYRCLIAHEGVCGDYAEGFALLANHAGLNAMECSSETHAWNIIEIDGQFYHCDSLWDEHALVWNYFNVSTAKISRVEHHVHDTERYPYCETGMDIFRYYDTMN